MLRKIIGKYDDMRFHIHATSGRINQYKEGLSQFKYDSKDRTVNLDSLEDLNKLSNAVNSQLIIYHNEQGQPFDIEIYDDCIE